MTEINEIKEKLFNDISKNTEANMHIIKSLLDDHFYELELLYKDKCEELNEIKSDIKYVNNLLKRQKELEQELEHEKKVSEFLAKHMEEDYICPNCEKDYNENYEVK